MAINEQVQKIRHKTKLTQAEFAEMFGVSRQTVQKWESGRATPEISKLVEISKHFDVSLDELVMGRDMRILEDIDRKSTLGMSYPLKGDSDMYASALADEYRQCIDEGLDIEAYKEIFSEISKLPRSAVKRRFGDTVFEIVMNAKIKEGYKYTEPSGLDEIRRLRRRSSITGKVSPEIYKKKIEGAWFGRICGCLLGKTVEGIRTNELVPLLKETGNYPMHRYILRSDIDKIDVSKYKFGLLHRPYADLIDSMPNDDDTNYTVLAQKTIEKYGRNFTPLNISSMWLHCQPKDAYFTAEQVAFCNFTSGYEPPHSAVYKNPYREWIGAQIRADYYGYINPGNTELAAEMAWRDASVSHVKNGIYGAMFVAAMLAAAALSSNIEEIILSGLSEIPYTSRLYEEITNTVMLWRCGRSKEECFADIHKKYDEYTTYGWCHTISNAMIVTASLLYGKGDYGKSVCMAVETGFDTDCNAATVGSILGMANGMSSIPEYWTHPINGTLRTSISGMSSLKISYLVDKTMEHIKY